MSEYRTIKDLVVETCMNEGQFPSYEKLTSLVLMHFPTSKWQKTHYAWYKSKIKSGEIRVPDFDGSVVIEPQTSNGNDGDVVEAIEASLSLEKDLQLYFAGHVDQIEPGLVLADGGVEYQTKAGRIDILAEDADGRSVVIELKVGKAKDSALGQLLGYMGCIAEKTGKPNEKVMGILIAAEFDQRLVYAAKVLPRIRLIEYKVSFLLQTVT